MTGRLIINAHGESAKAIADGKNVVLHLDVKCYSVTERPAGHSLAAASFSQREAVALALQILDAAGYSAEVWNMRSL